MNYIKSILFLSLSLLLWTSCENDGFYYQDEARIRLEGPKIWALDTDSIEFSFLTYPAEFTEMQIDIEACIMGPVTDYDRTHNGYVRFIYGAYLCGNSCEYQQSYLPRHIETGCFIAGENGSPLRRRYTFRRLCRRQ